MALHFMMTVSKLSQIQKYFWQLQEPTSENVANVVN